VRGLPHEGAADHGAEHRPGHPPGRGRRQFTATGPDQRWVAEITYCRTFAGCVYAAFVIRDTSGLIHHAAKGVQYRAIQQMATCAQHGPPRTA
jgi:hypothetical protein